MPDWAALRHKHRRTVVTELIKILAKFHNLSVVHAMDTPVEVRDRGQAAADIERTKVTHRPSLLLGRSH
jgi:hypothetical protein